MEDRPALTELRSLERASSRYLRKHLDEASRAGVWWDPWARGWWIGILFAIGSACFALGAVPAYARAVGLSADAITYFVGSIFFTTAGFLQYLEAADAGRAGLAPQGWPRRIFAFQPARVDWWATLIQLAGTLFFNASTAHAMVVNLTATQSNHTVWRPDALGSICFLVASGLAWWEVCGGAWAWLPHQVSWWIVALNMAGSVAFGVSAVASYIDPGTGQALSVLWTNLGTFVGAIGFLIGGVLLLPERS